MNTFKEFGLDNEILSAIQELGYEVPTPIQLKTIPSLLTGKEDIIALAQTGTGKTAAFGLPSIQLTDVKNKNTQTLVLSPTRELCLQIAKDLKSYSKNIKGLNVVAVYGGASIENQIKELKRGAQIVVGTPGRTKDLIKRKKLFIENIERVVLDEADEMLNMGFKEELDSILERTPEEKQTLLFSATMSREVRNIAKRYMGNHIELSVERTNIGAKNVKHIYYMVHARDKYEVLKRIADINPDIYGIVFCRTRAETKEVANKLMHDGYNSDALHGDLSQAQRDQVMKKFRNGNLQILVATDVAARGLDIDDLTHVINFNIPDDLEVYIHRSGRTGRAGKSGISITIAHTRDGRKINELERRFKVSFEKQKVPSGKEICTKQLYSLIDKIKQIDVNEEQIEPFLDVIYEKLEGLDREQLIKHFVSAEFNRFLDYYKNARDINISDTGKRKKKTRSERRKNEFERLFINAGSKNKLEPVRLIGLINNALDSSDIEIGKIDILKNFSFFEIQKGAEQVLIHALSGQKFEDVTLSLEISKEKSPDNFRQKSKSNYKRNSGGSNERKKRKGKGNSRKERRNWRKK
ncbi:MAG TPA: DEAD/DEAH box helicase [Bacteroidetes bacterium]|nr:DEAD/DEAH box helicase [Bacteroidota bacterium]